MAMDDQTTLMRGQAAESVVERYLRQAGLRIVERNYRCKLGELDIVALDPTEPPTLVFVEVRLRTHGGFGGGIESVDFRKQRKLRRTASCFLVERKIFDRYPCRFDIVAARSPNDLQWIRDAFR